MNEADKKAVVAINQAAQSLREAMLVMADAFEKRATPIMRQFIEAFPNSKIVIIDPDHRRRTRMYHRRYKNGAKQ